MTAEKPAVVEGVNELPGQGVPLLGEEGWLRRFGGFAPFSYWRSHPSCSRRGTPLS